MAALLAGIYVVSGSHLWVQLLALAFWIGVPVLVIWGAVSMIRGSGSRNRAQSDPEQILKLRLAQGEIGVEEYERLRGLIRSDSY